MVQKCQANCFCREMEEWRARVRSLLQQRAVVRAAEVARALGGDDLLVRFCLDEFVQAGLVEVLRPLGLRPGSAPDLEYYRWRRADDGRYGWQAQLHRPPADAISHQRPRSGLLW